MAVKLEGARKPYTPKNSDSIECKLHGVKTTWGALDPIQRLAVEEGIDTDETLRCLLLPRQKVRQP